MKRQFYLLPVLMVCLCMVSFRKAGDTGQPGTLTATQLKPLGRYAITTNQQLELMSSAVHFGFSFKGTQCAIYAAINDPKGHNYLQYELDGVYQKRIRIEGESTEPLLINIPQGGKHTIWIYKATEATTGPIFISKIVADDVKALPIPKRPLIEFIGNSITCGAASDPSEVPCGTGVYLDQHNAYMAYGPRVARALGVNFTLSSVSGIGAYRNWNSDGPTMPQVYEKDDFIDTDQRMWDFKTFTPVIVSIALGTNDFSNGDGKTPRKPFDPETFISTYVKFVELVKLKYPKARIALLSSPMVKGENRTTFERCLTTIKEKLNAAHPADKPVETFFFEPFEAHGCAGHPSVEEHGQMAAAVAPFFKKLLE